MTNFSLGWDFSPGSGRNPFEMKVAITWRRFLPGLKMFIPGRKAEKPHVIATKFQPRLKREFEQAHWRNIQRNKMAAMEKLCLNPGWNSPCNRNKISARWVGWNFSLGWNSPCNHPLTWTNFNFLWISSIQLLYFYPQWLKPLISWTSC